MRAPTLFLFLSHAQMCKGKEGREDDLALAGILLEVVQEMKREIQKDPDHLKV
jgi:hypothetical protein